jgi:hypothetical protein
MRSCEFPLGASSHASGTVDDQCQRLWWPLDGRAGGGVGRLDGDYNLDEVVLADTGAGATLR